LRIGYARVSTDDQDAGAQRAALKAAGCARVFADRASGSAADRPQLAAALKSIKAGDQLIVWKIDRLSRSLLHLLQVLAQVKDKGGSFRSLTEAIDTATPAGRAMMQMIGSFAEFEQSMIRERTRRGLEHARANGRGGGRPRKLNGNQVIAALDLLKSRSIADAAGILKVSRATLVRALKKFRDDAMTEQQKARRNDTKKTRTKAQKSGAGRN
jgi:DNA invertase Pin-like site-specific DNA recombinase